MVESIVSLIFNRVHQSTITFKKTVSVDLRTTRLMSRGTSVTASCQIGHNFGTKRVRSQPHCRTYFGRWSRDSPRKMITAGKQQKMNWRRKNWRRTKDFIRHAIYETRQRIGEGWFTKYICVVLDSRKILFVVVEIKGRWVHPFFLFSSVLRASRRSSVEYTFSILYITSLFILLIPCPLVHNCVRGLIYDSFLSFSCLVESCRAQDIDTYVFIIPVYI